LRQRNIEEGDYLVKSRGDVNLFNENVDEAVSTFDQVFRALSICETPRESVVCDLYGDPADGDIDVVFADELLRVTR
jgi:hypothetical protein